MININYWDLWLNRSSCYLLYISRSIKVCSKTKSYYTVTKSKVKDNSAEMLKQGNGFLIIPYLINNMTSL